MPNFPKWRQSPGARWREHLQEISPRAPGPRNWCSKSSLQPQVEYQKLSLRLDIIIKEAMKILRPSLPSTIEIKTEALSQSAIFADPTQMHQVLMNLCTNASHAMRDKGGVLRVGLRDLVVEAEDIADL